MYVDVYEECLLFGKHRGERIGNVATPYLQWMVKSLDLSGDEVRIVIAEISRRERCRQRTRSHYERTYNAPLQPGKLPAGVTPDLLLEVFSLARKTAARLYHPDLHGGDWQKMKLLNTACDYLEQQTRALAATGGRASA